MALLPGHVPAQVGSTPAVGAEQQHVFRLLANTIIGMAYDGDERETLLGWEEGFPATRPEKFLA